MRKLSRFATRSNGREQHRAFYSKYISSPEWFRRRDRWAADEQERLNGGAIACRGGCGSEWDVRRDDLHHCDYSRLGGEAHEDLWAMCRTCHDLLHRLMESSKSWRRLPRRLANDRALRIVITNRQAAKNVQYQRQ